MNAAHHYSTSLRAAPIEETLRRAKALGSRLGISRVTDITRLDRVGIPVFASIRPDARVGSLCVNAGKGVTVAEARVGAWMEAIEYALAEPGASPVVSRPVPARSVLDGRADPPAILGLCPLMNASIPLAQEMPCVLAEEVLTGKTCYVPEELVFLPAPVSGLPPYFGASSNGLASGNTVLEATVHGLTEVIEHDIRSFNIVKDTSALVLPETMPAAARALAAAIGRAGLQLFVRHQPSAFRVPLFWATIVDPEDPSPIFVNGGYGCHPHRTVALLRAICEAAQSRLSFIHGGRDDLTDWHRRIAGWSEPDLIGLRDELADKASSAAQTVSFEAIDDHSAQTPTLASCFDFLAGALAREGLQRILRVVLTKPEEELSVVKIIVPYLEDFDIFSPRVGPRLRDYAQS